MSDAVRAELLPEPLEMAALGNIVLEFDDVGALLDLSLILLNAYEGGRRGTENRGCQQGKSRSDECEKTHCRGVSRADEDRCKPLRWLED